MAIEFLIEDKEIIPIDIGTHDRVYQIWMESDELLDFGNSRFKMRPRFHVSSAATPTASITVFLE